MLPAPRNLRNTGPIQPDDLSPGRLATCSCGHIVRFFLGSPLANPQVRVFTRNNDEDAPYLSAEMVVDGETTDCGTLTTCGTHEECPPPEDPKEVEPFIGKNRCTQIPSCRGQFCAWRAEACFMECRDQDCSRSDGLPGSLACG
ncbi:hypothetical protein ACFL6C_05510 [Myxococcota bacterium]